jgi:RNA polymerase sigma-70 factor (ECF subfamily)
VALRVLGRDDEVDDVVQEVFLVVMADLDKLRNPLAVRGWLKTVTVRKAYRVLKQRGRRRLWAMLGLASSVETLAADSTSYPLSTQSCNPEDRVLLVRIYRLLDELPAQERLAWTLRYVEGEQVETVASLCGCSLATAKRRIAAAQTFLARTLSDA